MVFFGKKIERNCSNLNFGLLELHIQGAPKVIEVIESIPVIKIAIPATEIAI